MPLKVDMHMLKNKALPNANLGTERKYTLCWRSSGSIKTKTQPGKILNSFQECGMLLGKLDEVCNVKEFQTIIGTTCSEPKLIKDNTADTLALAADELSA